MGQTPRRPFPPTPLRSVRLEGGCCSSAAHLDAFRDRRLPWKKVYESRFQSFKVQGFKLYHERTSARIVRDGVVHLSPYRGSSRTLDVILRTAQALRRTVRRCAFTHAVERVTRTASSRSKLSPGQRHRTRTYGPSRRLRRHSGMTSLWGDSSP